MMAIYAPEAFGEEKSFELRDERFRHLASSLRAKCGDTLLALSGNGYKAFCTLALMEKKRCVLEIQKAQKQEAWHKIDLFLGLVKRDAFALQLKMATELGVRKLFIFKGEYSQGEFPKMARIESILHSAMAQSNNPYMPEVIFFKSFTEGLENIEKGEYERIVTMALSKDSGKLGPLPFSSSQLLCLGPEGGLSKAEESALLELKNSAILELPLPILRAPTALGAGIGHLMAGQ